MDENYNNNNNNNNDFGADNQQYNQQYAQPDYTQQNQQYAQPDYTQQNQQYAQPDYTQQNQQYAQFDYTQQYNQQYQQYGQQYNQQYPQYYEQPNDGSKGMGVASLVLGIISLLCCCFGSIGSILGIIFGAVSLSRKKQNNGIAIAGLIISCVALVVWIIAVIYLVATGNYNYMDDLYYYY